MTESQTKGLMQRLAAGGADFEPPPFEQIEALARLEEAFEARQRLEAPLDWIDAAWQSLALSALAALTVWLGEIWI